MRLKPILILLLTCRLPCLPKPRSPPNPPTKRPSVLLPVIRQTNHDAARLE